MRKKLLIGLLSLGALFVSYSWGYNSASYQGQNGKYWNAMFEVTGDNLHNANQQIQALNSKNQTLQADLIVAQAQPTPTPEVVYKTNTVTQTQYVPIAQNQPQTPKTITYLQAGSMLLGNDGSSCMMVGSLLECRGKQ